MGRSLSLRPRPILLHHLLRHILFEAQRRIPTRPAVCTALPTPASIAGGVVGAGAVAGVVGDGVFDEDLGDRRIGEAGFFRVNGEGAEQCECCDEDGSYLGHGCSLAARMGFPDSVLP